MGAPCFYLHVAIRGYDAEVFLNGAPILATARSYMLDALPTVSEWIVQGENVLSVVIHGGDHIDPPPEEGEDTSDTIRPPGEDDEPPDQEPEPPFLRVDICRGELDDLVEPGQENVLLRLEWTPPPPPAEGEEGLELPHETRESVELEHPWGRWSWEGAPVLDVDEPELWAEVSKFVEDLRDAIDRGRLEPLLDASQIKFDEVAPAYGLTPEDARARLGAAWPEITKAGGWRLASFDDTDLELRSCCEGRVIEPRTVYGEPVLRQAQRLEQQRWLLPIYIARIDGQLRIVR